MPPPSRPGWFARWFGSKQRSATAPATPARTRRRRSKDPLFTPQTHPGLSQEMCDFFNTPVGECDPEMLRQVVASLTEGIAKALGPDLGMDADELFATFCSRLCITPEQSGSEAPPAGQPQETAATPENAALNPAAALPPTPIQAEATEPANDAGRITVVMQAAPDVTVLAGPVSRVSRNLLDASQWLRHGLRSVVRYYCSLWQRSLHGGLPLLPSPRRFCYAACAGPP